jgi:hypothetical protein
MLVVTPVPIVPYTEHETASSLGVFDLYEVRGPRIECPSFLQRIQAVDEFIRLQLGNISGLVGHDTVNAWA